MRGRRKSETGNTDDPIDTSSPVPLRESAHAILKAIYQDEKQSLDVHLEAAKAARGYEMPKLSNLKRTGDEDDPIHLKSRIELVVIDSGVPQAVGDTEAQPAERRLQ